MQKSQGIGIVWAIVAIVYVIAMVLSDFDNRVVLIGALLIAIVAVTGPWWNRVLTSRNL